MSHLFGNKKNVEDKDDHKTALLLSTFINKTKFSKLIHKNVLTRILKAFKVDVEAG